ncbi:MAG: DEAD/DEAH box helicase [Eggerthellaceae bacterium]|jgi:ATP-dependent RNA helicase RhlE
MTKKFYELGLPNEALRAVDDLGYDQPTPVQEQAIPAILRGRDVIAAAKTGTGKTAAFCLPTIASLPHKRTGKGPTMLVLTPTRELAKQIDEVATTIAKRASMKVCCLLGGVSYGPQIKTLSRGVDVVVATPGRLIDLLNQEALTLDEVKVLVLDEADRMLDMGFLPDVRRIVDRCPDNSTRQTLLFSATIDKNIEKNLLHLLNAPLYIEIAHKGETADLVQEYQVEVSHRAKQQLLEAVLREYGAQRVIVFARTKYRVDTCVRRLRKAGYHAAAIHGDRSQNQRARALEDFDSGKVDILVATDILARGIDISQVPYIVNFDLPHEPEDYVHRIGRTGRAGEEGLAISFVTPDNAPEVKAITELIGHQIPSISIPGFDNEASTRDIAENATRKAAKNDPEIAAVMHEMRKERKRQLEGETPQEANKKKGKKSGKDTDNGNLSNQSKNTRGKKPASERKRGKRKEGPSQTIDDNAHRYNHRKRSNSHTVTKGHKSFDNRNGNSRNEGRRSSNRHHQHTGQSSLKKTKSGKGNRARSNKRHSRAKATRHKR